MAEEYSALEQRDAVVLAVSSDVLAGAATAARDWGPPFPILYNPDLSVINDYGVLGSEIAEPSTFIIDKNGVIQWKYVGYRIEDRPSPSAILWQLYRLSK